MTAEEASTLVGFLKSAFPSMTDEQMGLYESSLVYEDARVASRAILDGIKEWKFCPKYAEIMERIRMFARADQMAVPRPPKEKAVPPPFWVKRWIVARYVADPPDMRVFHEEEKGHPDGFTPAEGWMPEDAWIEEAEMLTPEQITKAMGATLGVGEAMTAEAYDIAAELIHNHEVAKVTREESPVPENVLTLARAFMAQDARIEDLEAALDQAARMGQRISREAMGALRDE